ncbi:MAG: arginyltransferase [Acidihalobacter sp.]|jgi:arginyl-tRNA--protein-N-Asp/Glu arginylyltransferase
MEFERLKLPIMDAQMLFFLSRPHACSYLQGQVAASLVADPEAPHTPMLYGELLEFGFRRSGEHVYAPRCPDCQACIPTRIPAADFAPSRSHRRCLKRNADLRVNWVPARHTPEYFRLYRKYLSTRHPAGGMDDPTPQEFRDFLISDWCSTEFMELRLDGRLVGVAVTDVLPRAFSAIYTFFDPELSQARSLGTFAILSQIEEARRRGLSHLYLGYWIEACDKMAYKSRFKPFEIYGSGGWQRLPSEDPLQP